MAAATGGLTGAGGFTPHLHRLDRLQLLQDQGGVGFVTVIHNLELGSDHFNGGRANRADIDPLHLDVALAAIGAGAHAVRQVEATLGQGITGALPPDHTLRPLVFVFHGEQQVLLTAPNAGVAGEGQATGSEHEARVARTERRQALQVGDQVEGKLAERQVAIDLQGGVCAQTRRRQREWRERDGGGIRGCARQRSPARLPWGARRTRQANPPGRQ